MESVEDLSLAVGQLDGMDHASQPAAFLDEGTTPKRPDDAFRGQAFFGPGCIGRDRLAIEALQEMVGGQGNLEQRDEGFDALG